MITLPCSFIYGLIVNNNKIILASVFVVVNINLGISLFNFWASAKKNKISLKEYINSKKDKQM